jgi:lysophospholipase L1-like esterase
MGKMLAIACLSFLLLQCNKKDPFGSSVFSPPSGTPPPGTGPGSGKKYLALGDSYTIGQSVPEADRFPVQTRTWLTNNGITINAPEIIAATGWSTTALQSAVTSQSPTGPYDAVSLLIGVNDQYQRHDTTDYRELFLQLLNTAIQLAGNRRERVFVLSIPDYSVTPFAQYSDTTFIRQQIDQFNAINKEVTNQNFCNYLDITPSTREAKNDPSLLAGDGLHPSGKEYKKWAERLGPMMKAVLQ